jgi:hypothetical protein
MNRQKRNEDIKEELIIFSINEKVNSCSKELIMWHIYSRQELRSQQRHLLLSNGFANKHVSTATI